MCDFWVEEGVEGDDLYFEVFGLVGNVLIDLIVVDEIECFVV